MEEEKKINKIEKQEKYRRLAQMNAALKAKLDFIKKRYDFTTNVKILNSEEFRTLVSTNNNVNKTVS